MYSRRIRTTRAARRLMALWAMLAMALAFSARPAAAAPFAYVANENDNTVSVIDIAANTVAATVAVGYSPTGVAVSPDGKFVYVANNASSNVSVIATATNPANDTVAATVAVGVGPPSKKNALLPFPLTPT